MKLKERGEMDIIYGKHNLAIELPFAPNDLRVEVHPRYDHHCGGQNENLVSIAADGSKVKIAANIVTHYATIKWRAEAN